MTYVWSCIVRKNENRDARVFGRDNFFFCVGLKLVLDDDAMKSFRGRDRLQTLINYRISTAS
jgi:hypothetical protein